MAAKVFGDGLRVRDLPGSMGIGRMFLLHQCLNIYLFYILD